MDEFNCDLKYFKYYKAECQRLAEECRNQVRPYWLKDRDGNSWKAETENECLKMARSIPQIHGWCDDIFPKDENPEEYAECREAAGACVQVEQWPVKVGGRDEDSFTEIDNIDHCIGKVAVKFYNNDGYVRIGDKVYGGEFNPKKYCSDLESEAMRQTCQRFSEECMNQKGPYRLKDREGSYWDAETEGECLEKAKSIPKDIGPDYQFVVNERCNLFFPKDENPEEYADCREAAGACLQVEEWPVKVGGRDEDSFYKPSEIDACIVLTAGTLRDNDGYVRIGDKVYDNTEREISQFLKYFRVDLGGGYHFIKMGHYGGTRNVIEPHYMGPMAQVRLGGVDPSFYSPYAGLGAYGVFRYSKMEMHDKRVADLHMIQVGAECVMQFNPKPKIVSLQILAGLGLVLDKSDDISPYPFEESWEFISGDDVLVEDGNTVVEADFEPGFYASAGLGLSFLGGAISLSAEVEWTTSNGPEKSFFYTTGDATESVAIDGLETIGVFFVAALDFPVSYVGISSFLQKKRDEAIDEAVDGVEDAIK